jgi:ComF family protein
MNILERLPVGELPIDNGWAVWSFEKDSPLQQLLHTLKYGNRPRIGRAMGRTLGEFCVSRWSSQPSSPPEILIPVPLFRRRYLERGYNQSEEIAEGMKTIVRVHVLNDVLIRSRPTRSQTNLSRSERWDNVADAFTVVNKTLITDRALLVVDDVLTTGATLAAAARALHTADPASIQVATLAVARLNEKERSSHY